MRVDYLAILAWNLILYLVLLDILFSSLSIELVFVQFQVVGFYPLLFDILLFFYILYLVRLYFKRTRIKKLIAIHFTPGSFRNIIIVNIIYLLAIGYFVPNFNPIAIIQITQGTVPLFTWIVLSSLIIQIVAFRINQVRKKISGPSLLLTLNFYLIFAFFLYSLIFGLQGIDNYSFFSPLMLFLNIQTITYDYAKTIMNSDEFTEFIENKNVPSRILTEAKIFDTEEDYKEGMAKGARTGDQLEIIRSYGTENYEMAMKIRDSNFPNLETFNRAQKLGMNNYGELLRYEQKQQIIELKEKIQRKKRMRFNDLHLKLNNLLKKTNKIKLVQLLEYLDIPHTKYLLTWLSNLPDDYPIKLEDDSFILNPNITDKQLQMVISNLLLKLDAKYTITLEDVEKVRKFFADLHANIRITMKQVENEMGLSEDKIDYIILFLLSKVPRFLHYNVKNYSYLE